MSIQKGNDQHDLNEIAHATKSAMTDAPKLPEMPVVNPIASRCDAQIVFKEDYDKLHAVASTAIEENVRLKDCLNHAAAELARAAYSEEFDSSDCAECIERINDTLTPMGKSSDRRLLEDCYDRLCSAAGVDNGDEIDIMPIVEQKLRELAAAETRAAALGKEAERYLDAIFAMADDGWLMHGVEGMCEVQEKVYAIAQEHPEWECSTSHTQITGKGVA